MSDSGNPSSALGDSVQQPNVSENSDSRTVLPPVIHPNVLAFQTTQDPAAAGGTRSNAEHEPVIYDSRLPNPLFASPPVNVSDSPCAQSSALTVPVALASSPRSSQPVLTSSNASVSRIQQVQPSTVERLPLRTPLLQPALGGSSDQQQLVPLVSGNPATPSSGPNAFREPVAPMLSASSGVALTPASAAAHVPQTGGGTPGDQSSALQQAKTILQDLSLPFGRPIEELDYVLLQLLV